MAWRGRGSSDHLVAEVGDARCRYGFDEFELHVLGQRLEQRPSAAEQDLHLMQNELVDEPCRQRRRHNAAAHQADVLIPGGLARRSDRVLDPCGDARLTRADLRRWPMTEHEEPCRRVWAGASPMAR